MQLNVSYTLELLDLLEEQGRLLEQKDKLINQLVKDNLEKENMLNELLRTCERA